MTIGKSEATRRLADAFRARDAPALRRLNDECIAAIALERDDVVRVVAFLSYALSKVLGKPRYWRGRGNDTAFGKIGQLIEEVAEDAAAPAANRQGAPQSLELAKRLQQAFRLLEQIDTRDRRFVLGLETKARLKVGATLYAQGISLLQAAELSGADERELLSYAGGTLMFDRLPSVKTARVRLADARRVLGPRANPKIGNAP